MVSSRSAMVEKWLADAEVFRCKDIAGASGEDVKSRSASLVPLAPREKAASPSFVRGPLRDKAASPCLVRVPPLEKSESPVSSRGDSRATSPLVPNAPALPKLPSSSMPQSLAARRKLVAELTVNAQQEIPQIQQAPVVKLPQLPPSARVEEPKLKITWCSNIRDAYELGERVMQSTNAGMDVLFGTRLSDGAQVVVKTRAKKESFSTNNAEKSWRRISEMILNLPESENIAQLYEVLEDATTYYIVMEKVDGQDLYETINGEKKEGMTVEEAKEVLYQLLLGVRDLHAKGCIHRDLKLENAMLDKTPKYGSSRPSFHLGAESDGSLTPVTPVTPRTPFTPRVKLIDFDTVEYFSPTLKVKTVTGTDQYIAPEAYAGRYSPASDIFAIGVIAYKLITGTFPYPDDMFDDAPGENWVGSPKMASIRNRLRFFDIGWEDEAWSAAPAARELAKSLLQVNQTQRPTAEEALAHPFFQ